MSAPVIASNSVSYPVRGAALATGVDYADALAWVWQTGSVERSAAIKDRIIAAVGRRAWLHFFDLIDDAWKDRRLRIPRWAPDTDGWRP